MKNLERIAWILGLVGGLLPACAGNDSDIGGESHFACESDADCDAARPGTICSAKQCVAPEDACGRSPLVGKYLWKAGNCEVGALSPFDAATCEATVCGNNARTLAECTGDSLSTFRVDGLVVTTGWDAPPLLPLTECGREPGLLFLADTGDPDDLWIAAPDPWPGWEECGDALRTYVSDTAGCREP